METDEVKKYIQDHFTDGLVLVVGSGLSAAEGIPGMPHLAKHLISASTLLVEPQMIDGWKPIEESIAAGNGLEEALLSHPPTDALESWIRKETCSLLLPFEKETLLSIINGGKQLRLTKLLNRILKPKNGLPILTTNYDRLVEIACERAGYHVDTTAVGLYAGDFDHKRSMWMSCRGILQRGRTTMLDHYPRAVVLKPHGSFDWYRNNERTIRSTVELDSPRAIITPGLNKYKAGYAAPFDLHRELANEYIRSAARLLIVGYGFNDDHLQTHLVQKINDGTPTLILTRSVSKHVEALANEAPNCVCVGKATSCDGITVVSKKSNKDHVGPQFWDINSLVEEVLQ